MRHAHSLLIRTRCVIGVREQIAFLVSGFLVIESLIVGQSCRGLKNVDDPVHCVVKEALSLEVAGARKSDGEGYGLNSWGRSHIRWAIEACGPDGKLSSLELVS